MPTRGQSTKTSHLTLRHPKHPYLQGSFTIVEKERPIPWSIRHKELPDTLRNLVDRKKGHLIRIIRIGQYDLNITRLDPGT